LAVFLISPSFSSLFLHAFHFFSFFPPWPFLKCYTAIYLAELTELPSRRFPTEIRSEKVLNDS
jgi:hypothetical protein